MPTNANLKQIIINSIPTKELYDRMKAQGLLEPNQLYLVEEDPSVADMSKLIYDANGVVADAGGIAEYVFEECQSKITANGILKGNGAGDISSAVAGTDFAPGGYGLGALTPPAAPTIDDTTYNADGCVKSGWYRAVYNTPVAGWWYLFVCSEGENVLTQFAFSIRSASGVKDGTVAKRYRSIELGGWSEWEYINPPMQTNVVYRTTERRNGSPVYKKMDSNGIVYWSTDQSTWNTDAGAKIETGSYVGTGTYGASNPNSLTFGFAPKILIVNEGNSMNVGENSGKQLYKIAFLDAFNASSAWTTGSIPLIGEKWTTNAGYKKSSDGKTIQWYHSDGHSQQFNTSGRVYNYVAIG